MRITLLALLCLLSCAMAAVRDCKGTRPGRCNKMRPPQCGPRRPFTAQYEGQCPQHLQHVGRAAQDNGEEIRVCHIIGCIRRVKKGSRKCQIAFKGPCPENTRRVSPTKYQRRPERMCRMKRCVREPCTIKVRGPCPRYSKKAQTSTRSSRIGSRPTEDSDFSSDYVEVDENGNDFEEYDYDEYHY